MDAALARWLVSDAAVTALAAAAAEPDPDSLSAGTRLRARWSPEQAAAVLTQATLRRRAGAKAGSLGAHFFWTADGLEQATRAPVAARRAGRFAALGVRSVVDLGCGIGADALAFAAAGVAVTGVERDEATAVLAAANLALAARWASGDDEDSGWGAAEVVCGDALALASDLLRDPATGVFCDPARRTARGRSWRVADLTPPWAFVVGLLDGSRTACVKLGPGVPHAIVPDGVEAEWVSDHGDVVECALWADAVRAGPAGPQTPVPGRRSAVVDGHVLSRDAALVPPPVGEVAGYLYEPDGAVIRAGLVPEVARLVRAHRVHDEVAYLAAPEHLPTPFATAFEILDVLPFAEKALRAWVRDGGVGTLEIKKRGLEVDPAALRRRLKPAGRASATLVLTPTPSGAVAVVARRVST